MKKILYYAGLFLLTVLLLLWNPFALVGAVQAAYFAIPLVLYFIFLHNPYGGIKSLSLEEKEYINKEKVKSFLRSAIQVLGAIVAVTAIIGLKIPFIDKFGELLNYLLGQSDIAIEAITTIIGIVLYLIGFFKDSARFNSRSLIEPKKINL